MTLLSDTPTINIPNTFNAASYFVDATELWQPHRRYL